jgi:NAD(P)-dependent dehydrogenase (short-subunit alcohol dehydrogenase family)
MSRFSLSGKRALVTGGGTGIGAGIARRMLEEDAALVTIVGRRLDVLEQTGGRLAADFGGHRVRFARCDVTSSDSVQSAVDLAADGLGLDIAVANAGGVPGKGLAPFLYLDGDDWLEMCKLTLVGTANTIRSAAWDMRSRNGGSIIAISSSVAVGPEICNAHYSAAKAGVDMMVRNAAQELGHFGIRVNSVQPGVTVTETSQGMYQSGQPVYEDLLARTPLGRSALPAEMGDAIVYLASEAGSFVSGQVFAVDGGLSVPPIADLQQMARLGRGDALVDDALKPRLA